MPHEKAAPARAASNSRRGAWTGLVTSSMTTRKSPKAQASHAWLDRQHHRITNHLLREAELREAPPEVISRRVAGVEVVRRRR